MPSSDLIDAFHEAMLDIHRAEVQLRPPYHAPRFLSMVNQHGGKDTADRLLAASEPSTGFTQLFIRGKDNLRISVEYLVLQNPWRQLFTEEQLAVARQRLQDVECELPSDDTNTEINANIVPQLPEELLDPETLTEGVRTQITINAYERNSIARQQCIEHYGTVCVICGFNFGARYGPVAAGLIHVHHTTPLSEIGTEYTVDPIADLRPVCPNCHAVIHLNGGCRTTNEVKELWTAQNTA